MACTSLPKENISAIMYGIDNLKLEHREVQAPGINQVLLRMHSVGICGSDVHYLRSGRIGDFIVKGPMVLGHESSGTVAMVGKGVDGLKPGDRVAIEPGIPCRVCNYCKDGRYNLCLEMKFCATPPVDGNLCQYYLHDADFCYKLPNHVTFEEGALLEPLSVGVHACRRAGVSVGKCVLVCGAGPIGLVNMMVARAMGAEKIIVTDRIQSRLDFAKKLGADATVLANSSSIKDLGVKITNLTGRMPEIGIECSGAEASIRLAIESVASGGVIVLVGAGPLEVTLPLLSGALVREVDIRGIFRYVNCYPTALSMVANGVVNVKPLVTNRFKLQDTLKAFETSEAAKDGTIKVIIQCDDSK